MLSRRALAPLAAALLATAAWATGSPPAASSLRIVEELEAAAGAVVGEIRAPQPLDAHGFTARLVVEESLVGEAEPASELRIVWEELARGRPPRFGEGDRVLVCLEPLPQASIWARRLPEPAVRARALAVAARGEAFLREPSARGLLGLEHYLALAPEERSAAAGAALLAVLSAGAELPLARSAVTRLDAFGDLDGALDANAGARLVTALLRSDADAGLRDALLALFARHRPAAVRAALEARLAGPEPVPTLVWVALGRVSGELALAQTELLLEQDDPALRAAAAESAPALSARRLAALTTSDPAPEVRAAAVTRLVALQGPAAIDAALAALDDPDGAVRLAAAEGLGSLGAESVPALRHVVESGSPRAAQAAVAALRFTGSPDAEQALAEIAEEHPDAGVRALARLALGRPLDAEHH